MRVRTCEKRCGASVALLAVFIFLCLPAAAEPVSACGVAVRLDGVWRTCSGWEPCRVHRTDGDCQTFEQVFPGFPNTGKITCRITLHRGEPFFRNDVSFERMPADALAGPSLDISPARGHKGTLFEDAASVALFEGAKGANGSKMSAIFVSDPSFVTPVTDADGCRVLAFRGQRTFTYWAGVDCSNTGRVTTAEAWRAAVRQAQDGLVPDRPVLPAMMKPLAPHPRLFVDAKGFEELKRKLETTELGKLGKARLLYEADEMLGLPPLPREMEGRRLLTVSRAAIDRIGKLAMAYRVTGNRAYARRAAAEAVNVSGFTDWNPSHFLDVGEMTLAVALGRDWLDDVLTADEKKTLSRAILEKGLLEDASHLKTGWWVRTDCNWSQVCHGGLAAGALAVFEDNPPVAEAVLRRARRCLPISLAPYAGGNFPEGPAAYWEYATDFTVLLLDVLLRSLEGAEPLLVSEGFDAQVEFPDLMTGPTGLFFNYSDAGVDSTSRRHLMAAPWFLARAYRRPDSLVAHEVANFREYASARQPVGLSRRSLSRLFPFVLLWLPESVDMSASPQTPLCRALGGMNPVAVLRSGFGADDWYVGIKAGTALANHSHMDVGSFVLDAGGIRWACDLGCEDYNRVEQMKLVDLWNRRQDSSRWSLFRLGADGHGTLVVDGARQAVQGVATVAVTGTCAVVDMSAVCPAAKSVVRTFSLGKDALRLDDVLTGLKPGAAVTWNMNTSAKPTVDGSALTLTATTASGARRRLRLTADGARRWETESLDAPKTPADSPNPGLTRVRLAAAAPADGRLTFGVTFELLER